MAKREGGPQQPFLNCSRDYAKERIKQQIQKGNELLSGIELISSESTYAGLQRDYYNWTEFNSELLRRLFTTDSYAREYEGIVVGLIQDTLREKVDDLREDVESGIRRLKSILDRLELIPETSDARVGKSAASTSVTTDTNVFIVHGSDEGAKDALARFIDKLELRPIILSEQPSAGRTIIEKFEDSAEFSDVGFAVVLMTPDDVGARATERQDSNFRARQNVIFELGYFVGKLGRRKVCALRKGDVEIPSDYSGVIYVDMDDSDGWKLSLAKELKTAGLPVDMNKAIQT